MEVKDEERKLAAKAILNSLKEHPFVSYILRLCFVHYMPFIYGICIAALMLYMINLRLSFDTLNTLANLLDVAYNVPYQHRPLARPIP